MQSLTVILIYSSHSTSSGGVGGSGASESALSSAGTFLSRVRAIPPSLWPDGGPESLRSPCGLGIRNKEKWGHGNIGTAEVESYQLQGWVNRGTMVSVFALKSASEFGTASDTVD
ncbi:hypothetical protein PoB_004656600 [Plakobranchus ocellatus]|uniref:Uncharacterized protein n=1 Tax=Plakobranchus ocellatus TaxID=259542 RepID=A0AAV4BHY0_9GAST|nr:hypothetical protein PoB_004656600 [Plakobranchus ocellatus]